MKNDKSSAILRIVAGGYLLYLAYNILQSVVNGETGEHGVFVIAAAVVFVLTGAALLFFTIRGIVKASREAQDEMDEETEGQEVLEISEVDDESDKIIQEEKTEE